ncbi:MAG TPA: ABC transporter ATP-binding protein [Burkholderiaceae bacterium]|jgi:branched-chain amino acid transport system ATP-binding protein|nr:ABC transporter ATP-binding protein [Burkholderiaceae bacterium]
MTDAATSSPGAGRERAAAAAATRGSDEPLLFVDDLHTYYGESHALQGVSLRVHAGEVVCLLGRNGAGKSTTLNSIVGLTPARSGTVRFEGEEIRRLPAHRIARRGLALVPEDRRIFAGLSVTENLEVASPARPARERRWPIERIFDEFPMLAEVREQDGATLSGGQQQMLAIARALAGEPRLLLLDEPNEGLAPVIVQQIGTLIDRLAETTTIVLTDQSVRFALRHAKRGYILQKGRIVYEGSAQQIAQDPDVQRYLTVA